VIVVVFSVIVVKLYVTVKYMKILSAFTENLCRWQQCKLHVPVFERNYIPTNLNASHASDTKLALKQKKISFTCGLLKMQNLAKQIVTTHTSMRRFSVFVCCR